MKIYVEGPYTAPTSEQVEENIKKAETVAPIRRWRCRGRAFGNESRRPKNSQSRSASRGGQLGRL
jgi:hypothetical protein